MNPNGDRDADFALKDLDPVTGKWRVGFCILSNTIY